MMKVEQAESEPKLYFQVRVEYEPCEATSSIPEDERKLESAAIEGFDEAEEIAKHTIQQIQTKFPDMSIIELELEQASDGYHLLVVDDDGGKVAKVGVTYTDYSDETIH
jgi:hypothetical protein